MLHVWYILSGMSFEYISGKLRSRWTFLDSNGVIIRKSHTALRLLASLNLEHNEIRYCAGGSVMDLMEICQVTLSHKEIAVCARHALLGLQYLHKNKIIHRDIKVKKKRNEFLKRFPTKYFWYVKAANLLLTEKGECKLADFGVSKRLHNTLAKTKTMIGTPYWMAPEVSILAYSGDSFSFILRKD